MYWRDVEGEGGGEWHGLEVVVDRRGRPGFHVEAGARSIRLMAGEHPILWARIDDDYWGYWHLRADDTQRSSALVLPPITAGEARSASQDAGTSGWFAHWARHFAAQLDASPTTPLHSGRWHLTRCPARLTSDSFRSGGRTAVVRRSPLPEPDDEAAYGYSGWDIGDYLPSLPLRSPAPADDDRVKAWRRQAREGQLPPLLLLWVAGLDRYVILDGHSRLRAAIVEGVEPHALGLVALRDEPANVTEEGKAQALTAAARIAANPSPRGRPYSVDGLNGLLLRAFDDCARTSAVTRAWPLEGGRESWLRQVRARLDQLREAGGEMLR